MKGFIKLHRQLLEWEWYDDIPVRLTFFHFLLKANWEDKKWKGITIKRGQILTGSIKTSKEIGITRQQFRRAIKLLKTTNEITTKATNKDTLVTIVNYNKYQDNEKETTTKTTNKTTNKQPTNNHQTTTTKEDKNIRTKEINNKKEKNKEKIYLSFSKKNIENLFLKNVKFFSLKSEKQKNKLAFFLKKIPDAEIQNFEKQNANYIKYKTKTNEYKHSLNKYLELWNDIDYESKLLEIEKKADKKAKNNNQAGAYSHEAFMEAIKND